MNYTKFRDRMEDGKVRGTDLARITKVPQSTMNDWLRKGKPMPADVIAQIGQYLNMTPYEIAEELLGLEVEIPEITTHEALDALLVAIKTETARN